MRYPLKIRPQLPTVGQLIEHLSAFDVNMKVDFSGLDFYRFKQRAPDLVQCEFNQPVFRDPEGNVVVHNLE